MTLSTRMALSLLYKIALLVLHDEVFINARSSVVEPAQNPVFRVALRRHLARFADELQDELDIHLMRRARSGYDVLLNHGAAEVVAAERQRLFPDFRPHRDPGRLEVRDVIKHEARDCQRL